MKTKFLQSTLLITCFCFVQISFAQFANNIPKKNKKSVGITNPKLTATPINKTYTLSKAFGVSNEYLVAAADVKISSAPALSDFRLWYNNGDHKVRTIGILHEQGAMNAKYSDQNGDDPFRVQAKWINIPGATGGTITAAGSGTFNIQLPEKPENTTLVISGFSFERQKGTDNNIRIMSIKINQENSIAQVSFIDDQGADYRSFVEPTMTSVLAVVPFGTLIKVGMSSETILNNLSNQGNTEARPYIATIQYAFIPNSRIAGNGELSGTSRNKSEVQGQIPEAFPLIYRSFILKFNNSDHHLLGVGIHLHGMSRFPGQRGSEKEPITWQDNRMDDPIQWFLKY